MRYDIVKDGKVIGHIDYQAMSVILLRNLKALGYSVVLETI